MIKILTVTLSLFSSSIVVHVTVTDIRNEVVMIKILTVTLSLFSSSVVVRVTVTDE